MMSNAARHYYRNAHPKILALIEAANINLIAPQEYPEGHKYYSGFYCRLYDMISVMMVGGLEGGAGTPDATLLHEIIHWSGKQGRLNRLPGPNDSTPMMDYQTEEATAQYGMFLLGLEFQIDTAAVLSQFLYDYILFACPLADLVKAQEDAMLAIEYLRTLAPEILAPRAAVDVTKQCRGAA